MATTWTLKSINKHGNSVSATIEEVINGVPIRTYTSERFHVDRGRAVILTDLRTKIKADRVKRAGESTIKAVVDLTAFEGSIK